MDNWHRSHHQSFPQQVSGQIGFEFSFAFQPIVDVRNREIISYEALVRGPHGEPSSAVFAQVPSRSFTCFDELCRQKAIHLASRLRNPVQLNLNIASSNIYEVDRSITATFKASYYSGIPVEKIVFEVLEKEDLTDHRNLIQYLQVIQDFGFMTAIDDFGAGYSGLKLLVNYQPNFIKLDRHIISNIQNDRVKQSIFVGIQQICRPLVIDIIAEGVESAEEYRWLNQAGVNIFQGFYFARPEFEALPEVANRVFAV
jgi:EAL domain-containing protein (putative c-di-GMP-specific phosphodiesterase class I)